MKQNFRCRFCAATVLFAIALPAWSQTAQDEQRLRALEQRVQQLESVPASAAPSSANAFNPALSLILSGTYGDFSEDPADYRIDGFALPSDAEVGPGKRGLSLGESELAIYANIDPYLYGWMTYSISGDDSASVEEAYIQTIALSHGLTLKAGRFFSGIGYLNSQHAHTWSFVDAPLVYQAMLGNQFGDDGVQAKWIAPTDRFVEFGAELMRGRVFPGSETGKSGAGAGSVFVHVGDDLGVSHSWRAGLSLLKAMPRDRVVADVNAAGDAVNNSFSGDSRIWIADLIWKYAPNGNATYTNMEFTAEYMKRAETGDFIYDVDGTAQPSRFDAKQSGWYLQGTYQFMPRWRVGLRTERLDHGSVDFGANDATMRKPGFDPSKNSLMVDYSPSEFSRFRVQVAEDKSLEERTDRQLFLQYQVSIGAHGAHQF